MSLEWEQVSVDAAGPVTLGSRWVASDREDDVTDRPDDHGIPEGRRIAPTFERGRPRRGPAGGLPRPIAAPPGCAGGLPPGDPRMSNCASRGEI